MIFSRRWLLAVLVVIEAGCTGRFARWGGEDPQAIEARRLADSGDYAGALRIYRRLATTSGDPDTYRARAADTALKAGDSETAKQFASATNPRELDSADQVQFTLLQARLDLNAGRSREAMGKLGTLDEQSLERRQLLNYHILRASALNQLGKMLDSAAERVKLAALLTEPESIEKNKDAIYDALSRLPDAALSRPAPPNTGTTLSGWMNLVRTVRSTPPARLQIALEDWRAKYPSHPANGGFLQGLIANAGPQVQVKPVARPSVIPTTPSGETPTSNTAAQPPASGPFIGVMLPLSGSISGAGQAIRTGLVAAYYADTTPSKKQLRFVDSESSDVSGLYRQLVSQGATAVIGPLTKEKIAILAKEASLPVPTLGLNQVPGVTNSRLFQFGLSPEDELEQAAGSAWFDGKQTAYVLAPTTAFGQRMVNHFNGYWRKLGGKVALVKTYTQHGSDAQLPVREITGRIAATSTSGSPPADFVLLVADNQDAQQILPLLAYPDGSRMAVYATSHVYNGAQKARPDPEMNGLVFCDIPWLLNPDSGGQLSVRALDAQTKQVSPDYVKLIALGLDAYRLVGELPTLQGNSQYRFEGATGSLSLRSGNRIQRQLECAQFENGTPRSRGIAPVLQSGNVSSSPVAAP